MSYNVKELEQRIVSELLTKWSPAYLIAQQIQTPSPEHQRVVEQAHEEWKREVLDLHLDVLPYIVRHQITDKNELARLIIQDLRKELSPVFERIKQIYESEAWSVPASWRHKALMFLVDEEKNKLPKALTNMILKFMYDDRGEQVTQETKAGPQNYGQKGLIDPGLISENMNRGRRLLASRTHLPLVVRRVLASIDTAEQYISDYAELIEAGIDAIVAKNPILNKEKTELQKIYNRDFISTSLRKGLTGYLDKPRTEDSYKRYIGIVSNFLIERISKKVEEFFNTALQKSNEELSNSIAQKKRELEQKKEDFVSRLDVMFQKKREEVTSRLESEIEQKRSEALELLGKRTKQEEEKINNQIQEESTGEDSSSRLLKSQEEIKKQLESLTREFFDETTEAIHGEQTRKNQMERQVEESRASESYTKNIESTVSSFASSVADKVSNILLKTYVEYTSNKDYSDEFNSTLFMKMLKEIDWEDNIKTVTLSELAKGRSSDPVSLAPELTKKIEQGLFSKLDATLKETFRRSQGVPMKTTVFVALIQAARQKVSKVIYSYVETLLEVLAQTQKEDLSITAFRKARKRYAKVSEPLKSTPDYSGKQLSRLKKKKNG